MNNISAADNLNLTSPDTWLTKSLFLIAKGNAKNAAQYLDHFQQIGFKHPLVLLVQALIDFNKANYLDCLKNLKELLNSNPRCPPNIRFAMGLCYYRLGNMEKARFAF